MNQYEGAKCFRGHELEWVAEGFGLCYAPDSYNPWSAWALTAPVSAVFFECDGMKGRDGRTIPAWVSYGKRSRDRALQYIEAEIAARNANPEAITLTPGPSYEEYMQAVGR